MDWEDCHLHAFDIDCEHSTVDDVADENRVGLNTLAESDVDRFTYTYDFGDDWQHTIAVEKRVPAVEGQAYPVCIAGKRTCPPDDCGGFWGYQKLLAIMADSGHPDHADYLDTFGEDFDPEDFAIEDVNGVLAVRFGQK